MVKAALGVVDLAKKAAFLLLITLFMCSSLAAAVVDISDVLSHYKMNNNYNDSADYTNLTSTNAPTYTANGFLGGAYNFDNNNDDLSTIDSYTLSSTITLNGWVNTTGNDHYIFYYIKDSNNFIRLSGAGNGSYYAAIRQGGALDQKYSGYTYYQDGSEWVMVTVVANGANFIMYENGIKRINMSSTKQPVSGSKLNIGSPGSAVQVFDGTIDEVSVFNRSLTQSEILYLYNNGSGRQYPFSASGSTAYPRIIIKAYDFYDNSSISTFTATLNNGSSISTTNGTAYFSDLVNGNYTFNITYPDYFNVTNNILIQAPNNDSDYSKYVYPYQSQINFSAYEISSGDLLSGVTFYVNGTQNTTFFLKESDGYTVLAEKAGYFNKTITFNVSALDNTTLNVTGLYQLLLSIYFRDTVNNSLSNATSLRLDGTTEDGDPYSLSLDNITTGGYNATLLHGYYNFTTLPAGFSYSNGSVNTTGNTTPRTINYYVLHYTVNSVSMYFYDELNFSLLTWENITIEFISNVSSGTYYTVTGTKFIDLLSPVEYNIRFSASGYAPRNYFFVLENNTYNILNLTLLANDEGSNVTINVFDTLQNALVGARVKVLKYIVPTNSYRLVDIRETNYEGQTNAFMQLNTEYYIFLVEYEVDNDGTLDNVLTTSASYIYSNVVNLYANTISSGFNSLFSLTGLYGVITYNNNTRKANFTYDDSDNRASQGCLYAYRLLITEKTLVNSSCNIGAAGSVEVTLPNINASYELRGYITKDAVNYFVTQKYVRIGGTHAFDDNTSLFLSAVIILSTFFLGFFAIELAVVSAGLATLVLSLTGLLNVSPSVTAPIFLVSLVLAFIISKYRRGGYA